jgi:segregation and condensation protein B
MPTIGDTSQTSLKNILEALLLASGEPLTTDQMAAVFSDEERPTMTEIGQALEQLAEDYLDRGVELKEVASGFRLQVRQEVNSWVSRLWEERPQRYSRALLETIALIAYRQPITRGDIEEVRGVAVRSNIIRTLQEREWIRVVGHRDVPGKPALFGTTKVFLDYFNLKSLDDLPSLAEIRDMDTLEPELDLEPIAEEA